MKFLQSFLPLFLFSFTLMAQPTNVKVEYVHTAGPAEQQVVQLHDLFLSNDKSFYLIKTTEDDQPGFVKTEKEDGSLHFEVKFANEGESGIFNDRKNGVMISITPLFDAVILVQEPTPSVAWKITGNTKRVAEYLCYEALGEFRGRKYSAWFTPDIPISAGPFKFSGLPGLILEVNEQGGGFNWFCKSIRPMLEEEAMIVQQPTVGKTVSFPEFYDLIVTTLQRQFARMGADGTLAVDKFEVNTNEWLERIK